MVIKSGLMYSNLYLKAIDFDQQNLLKEYFVIIKKYLEVIRIHYLYYYFVDLSLVIVDSKFPFTFSIFHFAYYCNEGI